MKAIVNLRVEIIEGEDKGYVLEETNRLIDLQQSDWPLHPQTLNPYKICVEFVTPSIFRRQHLEAEDEQ